MQSDLTVVILAAGLGTRMKSKKAKVLHEAGGMPLVEHVVRSSLTLTTPDRIVVVVGHQGEQVQQRIAPYNVRYAVQSEQRGTGHALMMCRDVVPSHSGRLVLLYGDCPLLRVTTLKRLLEVHSTAATVITTRLDDPTGYGRAITSGDGTIQAIVEQKVATPEQLAVKEINSGIYCFDAELLWRHLSDIAPNPISHEYYLTDIIEILARNGQPARALLHEDSSELLGINTRVELAEVDRLFRSRRATELMLAGVTIRNPDSVAIDVTADIGQDTVVEQFAQVRGRTVIGEDCVIGAGAIIADSIIGRGVQIAPYTLIQGSRIDDEATIGPFARLRQQSHVEAGAHIGNFVELKKTKLGRGAKAGHLAYLGDAQIGAKSNIGAGTITCNYDGERKFETTIGEGVFVGSNSTIVAPVQLGDRCYTAAGSVITHPVPADALAIGRGRQSNKDEWVKKRRERRAAISSSESKPER